MAEEPTLKPVVLAVFPDGEDRASLREIFAGSAWTFHGIATLAEARLLLKASSIEVVISECSLGDGHGWKDLLGNIQDMMNPPPLIVADRLADDRLWAEVLNLGCHDLLAKPFDCKEVLYTVGTAHRWREHHQWTMAARKAPQAAEPDHAAAETGATCGGRR